MNAPWHRSEPRDVRPFFAAQDADAALEQSGIRLTPTGEITKETSFELDESELRELAITVFPALVNPHLWMPEGFTADQLEFVLVARHPLLKRSEIISRYRLDQQVPEELDIPPEVLKTLGGGRNTQISVAVVLATDKPQRPGSPFVQGHWLARKSFTLRSRSNPVLFDIRTLDDEGWVQKGYPPKTFYAVEYQGGIESLPDEGVTSVATVYVHADAHNRMADNNKLGDAIQPLLASEIISSILEQALPDWGKLTEAPKGSALDTLLKQLGKSAQITVHQLADLARTKPSHLRALIQTRLNVLNAIK
jgi:hypothetical protein